MVHWIDGNLYISMGRTWIIRIFNGYDLILHVLGSKRKNKA